MWGFAGVFADFGERNRRVFHGFYGDRSASLAGDGKPRGNAGGEGRPADFDDGMMDSHRNGTQSRQEEV